MLVETSGIVEKAITAGKTLDQNKGDGMPAKWKSWEAPTLGTAYQSFGNQWRVRVTRNPCVAALPR